MQNTAWSLLLLSIVSSAAEPPKCGVVAGQLAADAKPAESYDQQDRGDADAYARYFAGMDTTARQKVGLAAAYLPTEGTVVDLGSGSGSTSADLARLYPRLKVIGVDINPKTVGFAREKYPLPNVEFREGDVADPLFEPESLDGSASISTTHHVWTFAGRSLAVLGRMFDNQLRANKYDRPFFHRDFVIPEGPAIIHMDVPNTDGKSEGDVNGLSTAALFETRFAKEFKSSVHPNGVPYKKLSSPMPGFTRYELDHRTAHEFMLHKDYRKDEKNWKVEVQEEYTYFTQKQFEAALETRGQRILISKPIYNPWIIDNRVRGKIFFSELNGKPLPITPTNYFIVGQKVHPEQAIKIEEVSSATTAPKYLTLRHFRESETGRIYDLATRPDDVVDVVPWFESNGDLYVMNRHEYPRPISNVTSGVTKPLNGAYGSGYVNEPLTVVIPPGQTLEQAVRKTLTEQTGLPAGHALELSKPITYLPSPGGIAERVQGRLVQVPVNFGKTTVPPGQTGLSEAGYVQPMQAQQALRSYHVGGMFESRLEVNLYELLMSRGKSVGPWNGAEFQLAEQAGKAPVTNTAATLSPPQRAKFKETKESAGYLEVLTGTFTETKGNGEKGKSTTREYVLPKSGTNTIASLPVFKRNGKVYVGLETRDLPAAQVFTGSSALVTAPAWRTGKSIENIDQGRDFLVKGLQKEFGVTAKTLIPLGGEYLVSPGVTPEQVMPFAVEIDASKPLSNKLSWVPLDELVQQRDKVMDAHLRITMMRLAHATGLIP